MATSKLSGVWFGRLNAMKLRFKLLLPLTIFSLLLLGLFSYFFINLFQARNRIQNETIYNSNLIQTNQGLINGVIKKLILTGEISVLLSVLVILTWFYYSRQLVTNPIKQLAKSAHMLAEGKFDDAVINYHSNDELGHLADSLRDMGEKLHRHYQILQEEVQSKTQEIALRTKEEEQKDNFIAMASHELRTPITSQRAYLQLLEQTIHRSGQQQYVPYVSKILDQNDKLIKLITDLLDVSKMNVGKLEINKEFVDLNSVVSDAVEEARQTKPRQQISLKGSIRRPVIADHHRISQVISNLINNAIKYSPEANSILVKLVEKDGFAVCSVQDFGMGIKKENLTKVFERFFQVSKNGKNTFSGMGIGLNIAAEIIRLHEGKIWVTSQLGKGSTFSISLPYGHITYH